MENTSVNDVWRPFSYTSFDGLTLKGRDYGSRLNGTTPLVCLPGLTRSTRDFDTIARTIAYDDENPRRVLALDYRGRGESDYDRNWTNYTPLIEANDVLNGITAAGMGDVALLGTSRGGIISMLLGISRPSIIKGVIMHDIGPELDGGGLIRIKNYVSRMPVPKNWNDAAEVLKTIHGAHFPNYSQEDWERSARLTFRDDNGMPKKDYDPALIKTLKDISPDAPIPTMWPQFLSLRSKPLLTIRGGISDLLSEETLETMDRAHPTMETVIVPDEGHVPSLTGTDTVAAIKRLLLKADIPH